MSYRVYTTDAVILKKFDAGEADRVFSFYTKDFGRVEVKAQGVRYLKSKLRYQLSGLSVLKVSFVSTSSEYYRLVGVEEKKVFDSVRKNGYKSRSLGGFLSLLARLVQGREKDIELWDKIEEFLILLNETDFINGDLIKFNNNFSWWAIRHMGYDGKSMEDALEQSML